jgi:hypothetical protein
LDGFGYIQEIGHKTTSWTSPDHQAYAARYNKGDTITVMLNLTAGTLGFKKNGVSSGNAFTSTNITAGTYRLAVSIGDSGDSVQLAC